MCDVYIKCTYDVVTMATGVPVVSVVEVNAEGDDVTRGRSFVELPVESQAGCGQVGCVDLHGRSEGS